MKVDIFQFWHEGKFIEYSVCRSVNRRRTIAVTVTAEGITVRAPASTAAADIDSLIKRKSTWIVTKLSEARAAKRAARCECRTGQRLNTSDLTLLFIYALLHQHTTRLA